MPTFGGYDPVAVASPAYAQACGRLNDHPLPAARAYGLRWHLIDPSIADPVSSGNPLAEFVEHSFKDEWLFDKLRPDRLPAAARDVRVTLSELSGCDPLAFALAEPGRPLPLSLHAGGADVGVSGVPAGTAIVLNFLHSGGIELSLDGVSVPAAADGWGRVAATLPAAGSRLQLRYRAPWGAGFALGGGLLLGALLCSALIRRAERRAAGGPT